MDIETKWSAPLVCLPVGPDGMATLMQPWTVEASGWRFEVPMGFKTDGASIPRFLWRICGHPLESPRVYAALAHDYLYGGGGPREITRKDADKVYQALLKRFGWGRIRADVEYRALRLFGGSHWTERTYE